MNKPRNVVIAVRILWANLAIELLGSLQTVASERAYWAVHQASWSDPIFSTTIFTFVLMFGGMLVTTFLIFMISAGHDWARKIFAALFSLGAAQCLLALPSLSGKLPQEAMHFVPYLLHVGIQVSALFLIFSKSGSIWFNAGAASAE